MDTSYVQRYYKINQISYSLFHSIADYVHMGVSRNGTFKKEDLLEFAHVVERYIKKTSAKNVLELARGRGANSVYLAKKYPAVSFHGIDISEGQLAFARRKANKLENFTTEYGDYHDLSHLGDSFYDIVFIVEALCYSLEKEGVFQQVHKILKKGGILIVADGYRSEITREITEDERLAMSLAERGMAVERLETHDDLLSKAKKSGFSVVETENVSEYIQPTLLRFEKLAKTYLSLPLIPNVLIKLLPKEFTYNAISGLLLTTIMDERLGTYYITVFKKE